MIIDCIADLHGFYPELEGGDLLIIAGDITADGTEDEYVDKFLLLLIDLHMTKYKKVVWIGGNHDDWVQKNISLDQQLSGGEYLCDSGTEFDYERPVNNLFDPNDRSLVCRKKLKIWGSPWTLKFPGQNPKAMAFTCDTEEELAEKWALIPDDTDILITHSPAYGILDKTLRGERVGSKSLQMELFTRLRPKLFVCGHIHEAYGKGLPGGFVEIAVNCSLVNERYEPVNKPVRVIL